MRGRPQRRSWFVIAMSAVLIGALALPAAAKPGDIDQTYGQNGWAWAPFRACDCGGNASMRLQPDGKIVALGATGIARFLNTGALDKTFGTAGVVALNIAPAVPDGLTVDHAGRIVVVAHTTTTLKRTVLRRWSSNGIQDGTFASTVDGTQQYRQPLHPVGIAEQMAGPGARYVIGGSTPTGAYVVLGVRSDGKPDTSFGVAGRGANQIPPDPFWGLPSIARSLALEPGTGRILLAGTVDGGGGQGLPVVTRFTVDGLPDAGFGRSGVVQLQFLENTELNGIGLAVAPGGASYVTAAYGAYRGTAGENFVVWKLTPSGGSDESFNAYSWGQGYDNPVHREAALPLAGQRVVGEFAYAIAVAPNDKVLVSGTRFTMGKTADGADTFFYRTLVLRLLPDGSKDPTFGASGWANGLAGDGSALLVHNGQVLVGGDLRRGHPTNPYYDGASPPPGTRLGFRITRFAG